MTNATVTYRLTSRQKWQLALSVFVVYWPIRVYVNTSNPSWAFRVPRIPFFIMEILLSILFFYLWISITELVQRRLSSWFGEGFLIEFKIPAQLVTLLVASFMALTFNFGFYALWRTFDDFLEEKFTAYRTQTQLPPKPKPGPAEEASRQAYHQQRARTNNGLTVMALLSAFYLAANRRTNRRLQDMQLQAERLEKENIQAQFAALKKSGKSAFSIQQP